MSAPTRSQRMAQMAYERVADRKPDKGKLDKEYVSFAKKFPALIHTCGLAQAVAFAGAKQRGDYLTDLAAVLKASGHSVLSDAAALDKQARTQELSGYLRLSRDALQAANWLKRYVEAVGEDD